MIVKIKGLDVTHLFVSYTWSGSIGRVSRGLQLAAAAFPTDPAVPLPDFPLGAAVTLQEEDGRLLFTGMVVSRQRSSDSKTMEFQCLDRGMYLAGNDGFYVLDGTPESCAGRICREFGIPVGFLAPTGVVIQQKFPGAPLSSILEKLYAKASEQTGKAYFLRFEGEALCIREKPAAPALVLDPDANVMRCTVGESVEKLKNSVAIYTDEGALIRTVDDADAQALFGKFQKALIQKKGTDATEEAKKLLRDGQLQQDVSVEVLGNTGLTAGSAVTLVEGSSGVRGLFWIDSDTHTWKNGQYFCRLDLNFQNLMG